MRRKTEVVRELMKVVAARRAANDPSRTDILSLLLSARDEEGKPLTDDELRDELLTMLLAGHETTATALSWTFACILQHPEVEERLRTGEPEWLDAVIKEALRLRPILPDVVRKLKAPMTVAGYEIPEGANLMPTIYLAHRNPEKFPEPERFKPERFLGAKVDPYAWLPFGGGIRRCIGMAFALYEMKIVVAEIIRRTRLSLADPHIRVVRRTITLAPSGGTRVVLRERLPATAPRADATRTSPAAGDRALP
jgi:cytochrome P450